MLQQITLRHLGIDWEVVFTSDTDYLSSIFAAYSNKPYVQIVSLRPKQSQEYNRLVNKGEIRDDYFMSDQLEADLTNQIIALKYQ